MTMNEFKEAEGTRSTQKNWLFFFTPTINNNNNNNNRQQKQK